MPQVARPNRTHVRTRPEHRSLPDPAGRRIGFHDPKSGSMTAAPLHRDEVRECRELAREPLARRYPDQVLDASPADTGHALNSQSRPAPSMQSCQAGRLRKSHQKAVERSPSPWLGRSWHGQFAQRCPQAAGRRLVVSPEARLHHRAFGQAHIGLLATRVRFHTIARETVARALARIRGGPAESQGGPPQREHRAPGSALPPVVHEAES